MAEVAVDEPLTPTARPAWRTRGVRTDAAADAVDDPFEGDFRFEIPRFDRFRVGVLGDGEGAGEVVEPLQGPEVGVRREKSR